MSQFRVISWMISKMLLWITRSVAIPKSSVPMTFVKTAGADRATASDIRSESRTDCESSKLILANMPDR